MALSTLLGRDEQPGEIPGLGPVPASHARAVVAQQRRAEWRYAVTDTEGRLLFDGITRRRPTGLVATGPRGGIVELHVPEALLAEFTGRTAEQAVAALGGRAGRHRPPVRRPPPARPRRPSRRPAAARCAAPPHPDPRPHLRRHRLPPSPRPLRPGPHGRVPGRRPDRRRRPGAAVPSRPHPQGAGRVDPRAAGSRTPSSGEARSAGGTRSGPSPSCHRYPTSVPVRTIPGTTRPQLRGRTC